jgi:hypothetical protein
MRGIQSAPSVFYPPVKPRIHKLRGSPVWICEGSGLHVCGYSIEQAYKNWLAEEHEARWLRRVIA